MFKNRSVVELMVITFTVVVSLAMLFTAVMIVFVEIRNPQADTAGAVSAMFAAINIVLGALLGLLAGKSESVEKLGERPDKTPDDISKSNVVGEMEIWTKDGKKR